MPTHSVPNTSNIQKVQQRRQTGLFPALEGLTVYWEVDPLSTIKKCCAHGYHFPASKTVKHNISSEDGELWRNIGVLRQREYQNFSLVAGKKTHMALEKITEIQNWQTVIKASREKKVNVWQ